MIKHLLANFTVFAVIFAGLLGIAGLVDLL